MGWVEKQDGFIGQIPPDQVPGGCVRSHPGFPWRGSSASTGGRCDIYRQNGRPDHGFGSGNYGTER